MSGFGVINKFGSIRVGIDIPTIEVRYEHLNVEAEAYVGSRALPTFLNFVTNMVESFFTSLHILSGKKKHVTILKDVSGIIKPRRMALLLGPPSSGKTTLLLALSGKLDPSLKLSGRVTYNGHGMNEFVPQRTAAYISQHDVHIGEMTVRETLAFSARCQGVGTRHDLLSELARREKEAKIKPDPDIDVYMKAAATGGQEASLVTDYVLKILGLDICADTIMGDEMLRGYNKILVYTLFKQYLVLLLINQMSSGLFRAIAALGRNMIVAGTFGSFALLVLFALGGFILSRNDIKDWWIWGYWISPLMYGQNAIMVNEFLGNSWNHFTPNSNKTLGIQILESRGFFTHAYWYWIGIGALIGFMFLFNIIYTLALAYLNPFEKPQTAITEESKGGMPDRRAREDELTRLVMWSKAIYKVNVLYTNQENWLSELERLIARNKQLIAELGNPAPGSKDLHFPTQYSQSLLVQCLACLWKQHWSYWRNPPYTAVRFLSTTVIAVMFGTMFWGLGGKYSSRQDLFNAIGSMYNAVLFMGIQNSTSVQPVVAIERTVFYRERAAGMYSALPYAIAQVIIELPYIFVQATSYSVIVYAMMGFEWTIGKFFWYIFFMYFTLCYYTFYGMMAVAITPNHHVASVVSAAFYGIWNLFSGFVIARPSIPVWWRWYYWACPVAWTIYGLVASQFGDITNVMKSENKSVQEFIRSYFGIKHDFIGVCAIMVSGFAVLFVLIFAVSIKAFNFQRR
ncbi:ABC transporter G family member 40 [Spatholobus suberectus]|nr:ABC transporter G family member 40 [Spatholobus suberectus]